MLKKFWPQAVLFFLVLSIVVTNYFPGTWLSGWDNLHPEFNFWLNIKRSIFSVWQEYQGLGLLGGMGHAADLPRQLLLWFTSLVIPPQLLRYFYHFLMLFVGILGIYCLSKDYILAGYEQNTRVKGSILAAIFYLLNLGTIQYFYVPFEPYSTFWGLFPWEIYVLIRYFNDSSRKNLTILFLINLLAVPQGYIQTIFLVYALCVGIFATFNLLRKRSLHSFTVSFKAILVILSINAFWLLPTFYFMKNSFLVNRNAMQNYMATDKFFQMNRRRGTLSDFVYLKEFYYDFIDYDHVKGDFDYMMTGWRRQFSQNSVSVIGLLFFIFICLGLFKKSSYRIELTTLFTLSGIFFLSDTYLISLLNDSLRQFAVTDQLLRNPFTKFIVPTVFTFSLLFGLGAGWLINLTGKINKTLVSKILFSFLVISFAYVYFPVWRGDFIYKFERAKIPGEYFQLFDNLNRQTDKGRVANFPQSNIWGWAYYKWGLTGSGFSWYAVEQPFLDRAFDVWSDKNENYYWEVSNALYSENLKLFNNALEKYQIRWFLIDENVFSYTHYKGLNVESLKLMLDSSGKVIQRDNFGKLTLYEIKLDSSPKNFVFLAENLPVVGPSYLWNNFDQAYLDYGNYISDSSTSEESWPPLRSSLPPFEVSYSLTDNRLARGFGGLFGTGISVNSHDYTKEKNNNYGDSENNSTTISHTTFLLPKNLDNTILNNQQPNAPTKPHANITQFNLSTPVISGESTTTPNTTWPALSNILARRDNSSSEKTGFLGKGGLIKTIYAKDNTLVIDNSTIRGVMASQIQPVTSEVSLPHIYYPFRSLFTGRKQEELEFEVEDNGEYFSFTTNIPADLVGAKLVIPEIKVEEVSEIDSGDQSKVSFKYPEVYLDGELIQITPSDSDSSTSQESLRNTSEVSLGYIKEGNLEVRVPKINGYYSSVLQSTTHNLQPKSCDEFNKGEYKHNTVVESGQDLLRLTSIGSSNCLDFDLPNLTQRLGYLITVENRNVEGKSLLFAVINKNSQRADLETYLPKSRGVLTAYFVIPPMEQFATGYTLHFDNISIGRVKTVNDVGRITVNPIPYRFLTGFKITQGQSLRTQGLPLQSMQVNHPNPSFYQITFNRQQTTENMTLILSQSFDNGWKAYRISNGLGKIFPFWFGQEIKNHVLVNNWENGWHINETMGSIVIVYVPQYLEYIGFGLLFITPLFLLVGKKKFV